MRFFLTCVVLAAGCVAGVLYFAPHITGQTDEQKPDSEQKAAERKRGGERSATNPAGASGPRPATVSDEDAVAIVKLKTTTGADQSFLIRDGRITPVETQNVPSERDGKLVLLATPVGPDEKVEPHLLIEEEVNVLATRTTREEWLKERPETRLAPEVIAADPVSGRKAETIYYRYTTSKDNMEPGTTLLVYHKQRFRKLNEGDLVKRNQVLGWVNPAVAIYDLAIKQAKIEGANHEIRAARSIREESERQLQGARKAVLGAAGAVSRDEIGKLQAMVDRYTADEAVKQSALLQSRKELAGSLVTFELFKLTASIDGRIKTLFKNQGDAVKNLEPVLQIQNPLRLRVEAQVDIADAKPLLLRLDEARRFRREAQRLIERAREANPRAPAPPAAVKLEEKARSLVAVEVEASRPEPPRAKLEGHLKEITAVGVTRGKQPTILSASADGTVRLWQRQAGSTRWEESERRLNHRVPVRALACTGPKAKANLVLTATSGGVGRVFDLDNLDKGETRLKVRHTGAINAVAFNAAGTLCATAGEDRVIRLHDPISGELRAAEAAAHQAAITSLAFTPQGQLVSAGRDKRLVVWDVKEDENKAVKLEQANALTDRSGEVAQLGVSPDGQHVLFDEGRELRVLSIDGKKLEGSLSNAGSATSFSGMALFSPDGQTILTNGAGPGRLQLWRAPFAGKSAAELRQFLWANGTATCAAFAPESDFVVTGTSDHRVLVWEMPDQKEIKSPIAGELIYVEQFLDTSLRRVTVRAAFDNPTSEAHPEGVILPGSTATIKVPTRATAGKDK